MLKKIKNYRYERKFVIPSLNLKDFEYYLKVKPLIFNKVYVQRRINNIYFDSINYNNFFDNISGNSKRVKPRIRWYGTTFGILGNPILEYKIKKESLNSKLSYPLTSFSLNHKLTKNQLDIIWNDLNIPLGVSDYMKNLFPSLLNSYNRKYYLSACKRYRITIDDDLLYYKIFGNRILINSKFYEKNNIIIELKYDKKFDENADSLAQYLKVRLCKNSKYVNGVLKTNFLMDN